ncbi:hypothetical protein [Lysobacter xanthus]
MAVAIALAMWSLLPRSAAVIVALGFAPLVSRLAANGASSRQRAVFICVRAAALGGSFAGIQHYRLVRQTAAVIEAVDAYKLRFGQYPQRLTDAGVRRDDGPVRLAYLNEGAPFMWYDLGVFDGRAYHFAQKTWGPWPE